MRVHEAELDLSVYARGHAALHGHAEHDEQQAVQWWDGRNHVDDRRDNVEQYNRTGRNRKSTMRR